MAKRWHCNISFEYVEYLEWVFASCSSETFFCNSNENPFVSHNEGKLDKTYSKSDSQVI